MNRSTKDDIIKGDKCIIIEARHFPHFVGLEVEVVEVHEPPCGYLDVNRKKHIANYRLYEVEGPHLPETPPINGEPRKTWLCPRWSLMKIPPDDLGDDEPYEDNLDAEGNFEHPSGIVVTEEMSEAIKRFHESVGEPAEDTWHTHPRFP